ncbi:MAG: DUF4325 domain-containing protein [Gammaproteobacteria bacterium]|nr:DUF4325 domain-containing protein [Gammaproteobacteria bacterium]
MRRDITHTQLRDQLFAVKNKMRQAKKVSLELPAEFTFNKDGVKHFDGITSWFRWDLRDVPVEIDFRKCSSANYQSMSLLILYCWKLKQNNCTVSFIHSNDDSYNGSRVWRMLGAQALFSVTTDPKISFPHNEHKPIFAVRNSDDFKAATSILESFTEQFGLEYQSTLRYIISELLYNVLEHGSSDFFWRGKRYPSPGLVQFTWYEKINELHFIVADNGVGIRQHLSQAHPALSTDQEAIRLAIQPEISGTFGAQDPYSGRNNAGMGLYLSSNIAKKLRGEMYICSGDGVVHISPQDTSARTISHGWPGTFVLLTIRMDRGTEFALDSMMNEFRERARTEVQARDNAKKEEQLFVSMANFFGSRAEVKEEAINYRNKYLIPAAQAGKTIILDFSDVLSSTHSFLNALLASPIRIFGLRAYKRIRIVNAKSQIHETISYILDDNTDDS